jgi:eukaryotic translation initiation factor 2C
VIKSNAQVYFLTSSDFLDHLMRQGPSEIYTLIKRNFFSRGGNSHALDNVIVAMKGAYASLRLCNVSFFSNSIRLVVDVSSAQVLGWPPEYWFGS